MMACLNVTVPIMKPTTPQPKGAAIKRRGRPPKPEGALTDAERKAAQRERNRVAIHIHGAAAEALTTTALVEGLPGLIAGDLPGLLGVVLVELGRRGGLAVIAKKALPATG